MSDKKKYLLHHITDEDARYIAEDTYTPYEEVRNGNCYCLVNKKNGKVFRENGNMLIYRALPNDEANKKKRRFLEAVEACAYFRGYANLHDIKFKTSKIAELLYKLEDHEIEIPDNCNSTIIISTKGNELNQEVRDYISRMSDGYAFINSLQRDLPGLALFVNECECVLRGTRPNPVPDINPEGNQEEIPWDEMEEDDLDFEEEEDYDDYDDYE